MSESDAYRLLRARREDRKGRGGPPAWFLRALGLERASRPYSMLKARAALRREAA